MEPIRAFVAIELPEQVKSVLTQLQNDLKRSKIASVKWAGPAGIHLTLKFLGNVDASEMPKLKEALSGAVSGVAPFSLELGNPGAFPNTHAPRVVWVGLEEPRGELSALQRAIEAECVALGLPAEDRPFSPHLTLGRVRREAGAEAASFVRSMREREQTVDLGEMTVDSVHLFRSDLRPTGAEYRRLHSAVLEAGR